MTGAEVVGIAPDPTAVAALGAALLQARRTFWLALSVVPMIWLALSALTLGVLDEGAAVVPAAAVALALAVLLLSPGATPRGRR